MKLDDDDRSTLAIIALLGVIMLAVTFLHTRPLHAQDVADRGSLVIRAGSDTLVQDRFRRSGDTLQGTARVKGQGRVDYLAVLGTGEQVRSLDVAVFAPGAVADTKPVQRIHVTMQGDTAVAEVAGTSHRVPTRAGAIPMMNNLLAMAELFTRRERASGGAIEVPYLALAGGATLAATVTPAGPDSLVFMIGKQEQRLRVDSRGRIVGGSITGTQMVLARGGPESAGAIESMSLAPMGPPPDYSAPTGAPYTAEEVSFVGPGGIKLGGTLTKPKNGSGPFPAVVTITGSGQQDRDEYIPFAGGIRLFRQVADTLSRRGIAVLRLDDRGVGASGGDPSTSTSADFADDIRAGLAFLRTRKDIDPKRLALAGHSEGGVIAPMIAATDPELRAMLILAGPGEAPVEISMAQNRYLFEHTAGMTPAKRDSLLAAARASLAPEKQTVPWLKFWMGYDPVPAARKVKAATLIVQGATDRQVPVDQAEKLAALIRAGGNRDVTVKVFPATNHLFIADPDGDFNGYDKLKTNKVAPEVLGVMADWLALKLRAASTTP